MYSTNVLYRKILNTTFNLCIMYMNIEYTKYALKCQHFFGKKAAKVCMNLPSSKYGGNLPKIAANYSSVKASALVCLFMIFYQEMSNTLFIDHPWYFIIYIIKYRKIGIFERQRIFYFISCKLMHMFPTFILVK